MSEDSDDSGDDDGVREHGDVHVFVQLHVHHHKKMNVPVQSTLPPAASLASGSAHGFDAFGGDVVRQFLGDEVAG